MGRLTDNEVDYNLTTLEGWALDENESRIIKSFVFKDFKEAITAMVKIGEAAEELGHHPDWYNSYNKLNIKLSTHDAGGITIKDFELAKRIEDIIGQPKQKRPRLNS
ncbi:MAG: 4a-hydroxytetrahydrobiopterin dehydratase [Flavobacteriales bacterium]|nr:MAG: 4a-hydroxytetrahydrobiopterin dehydratase [Flavobacteriales bacterium]